jgi:ATP-dependent DNA helicase RecQ
MWPAGGLPRFELKGKIPEELRAQPGKALCIWGDSGWGQMVKDGKYEDGHYPDALVTATARLVGGWRPSPPPAWVTCLPSRRHPDLVPDFAKRLAASLKLPFHEILEKTDDRPEQKEMANSSQQAQNVDGSLGLSGMDMPEGPLLLVDDMVDSGWTLTVASWLLRSAGSGEVFPLALAYTGNG